jgi:hypothetical protein
LKVFEFFWCVSGVSLAITMMAVYTAGQDRLWAMLRVFLPVLVISVFILFAGRRLQSREGA